jgi:hypothetical protein
VPSSKQISLRGSFLANAPSRDLEVESRGQKA